RNDEYPNQHGRAEHQCQLQPSSADGQPVECIGEDGSSDHRQQQDPGERDGLQHHEHHCATRRPIAPAGPGRRHEDQAGKPHLQERRHGERQVEQVFHPPSWCFATKPSNPCSLPLNLSAQLAARTTRDPSTPTTVSYRLPCTASFTSSALPLEYRQFFCRASPLSA